MKDNNAWIVFTKLLLMVSKNKGEWAGGRRQLAKLTNINENTLKDVLERLEKEHLITRQPNTRYTVITICNWTKYQKVTPNMSPMSHPQPTHTTPTRHHSNKNKKENKKEKGEDLILEESDSRASEETKKEIRLQLRAKGLRV